MGSCANWIAIDILDYLKQRGVRPEIILLHSGITTDELECNNGRLNQQQYWAFLTSLLNYKSLFYEYLIEQRHSPETIHFVYQRYPELIGLCLNSPDVATALQNFVENRVLIEDTNRLTLHYCQTYWRIELDNEQPDNILSLGAISNFILIYNLLGFYCKIPHVKINISHIPSSYQHHFDQFFNDQCEYNHHTQSMLVYKDSLTIKNSQFNHSLYQLQKIEIKKKCFTNKVSEPWDSIVAELVEKLIEQPVSTTNSQLLVKVCRQLNISRWTLNQRLKHNHTHFTKVVHQVRIKKACDLLINTNLPMLEISQRLGLSSQAVFSRLFKSSLNCSPLLYRRCHQDN